MRKLITLAVFALFSLATFAQAEMTFEETTIDYGTISKGEEGLRVFKFTNTGDQPLVISNVRSTCGCTVPKRPTEPILPGEEGEIEVKYNTRLVGPIRRTVTVYSNATEEVTPLKIKGTITE